METPHRKDSCVIKSYQFYLFIICISIKGGPLVVNSPQFISCANVTNKLTFSKYAWVDWQEML